MTKYVLSLATLALLAGCVTGGSQGPVGSGFGGNIPTLLVNPKTFSPDEFKKDPKSYATTWVAYKGEGINVYKKITIPTYTLDFQKNLMKNPAGQTMAMNIGLPVDTYNTMMKEIAEASFARLKQKFKTAGVEVVAWNDMKSRFPAAISFEKEQLSLEPIVYNETMVSYAPNGAARLNTTMWQNAAGNLSRAADVAVIMPNFTVGYGYFEGQPTQYTIKDTKEMKNVGFTPQIQIYAGSGFHYQSKWDHGMMTLANTMVLNEAFVAKLNKVSELKQAHNKHGKKFPGVYRGVASNPDAANANNNTPSLNYELSLDKMKFKKHVLMQLDAAENLIVERYKNQF